MTMAELRLCDWQHHRSGSFFKTLFDAISLADNDNLDNLAAGFPEEIKAFRRYRKEQGYWPKLKAEYLATYRIIEER